jgi:hypothetical protein
VYPRIYPQHSTPRLTHQVAAHLLREEEEQQALPPREAEMEDTPGADTARIGLASTLTAILVNSCPVEVFKVHGQQHLLPSCSLVLRASQPHMQVCPHALCYVHCYDVARCLTSLCICHLAVICAQAPLLAAADFALESHAQTRCAPCIARVPRAPCVSQTTCRQRALDA